MKRSTEQNIIIIIAALIVILFSAPLAYFSGWCTGWFAEKFVGEQLCNGINLLFKTSFIPSQLPNMCGVVFWLTSFFRLATYQQKN